MNSGFALLTSLLIALTPTADLVKDLGDNDWRVREHASYVLDTRMDRLQSQQLEKALVETKDLEVRQRVQVLLDTYKERLFPTQPPQPECPDGGCMGLGIFGPWRALNPFGPIQVAPPPKPKVKKP